MNHGTDKARIQQGSRAEYPCGWRYVRGTPSVERTCCMNERSERVKHVDKRVSSTVIPYNIENGPAVMKASGPNDENRYGVATRLQ